LCKLTKRENILFKHNIARDEDLLLLGIPESIALSEGFVAEENNTSSFWIQFPASFLSGDDRHPSETAKGTEEGDVDGFSSPD
jgi:hypothetical protein